MPARRRLTRLESQAQTRQRLLDAALAVFAAKGLAAATVEEIAERAGYSRGAVYANFASKEDLALAVLDVRNEQRLAELAQTLPRFGADPEFWRHATTRTDANPWDALHIELWVRALHDDAIQTRLSQQVRDVRARVAEILAGQAAPEDRHRDAAATALACLNGFWLQYALEPQPWLLELVADTLAGIKQRLDAATADQTAPRPKPRERHA